MFLGNYLIMIYYFMQFEIPVITLHNNIIIHLM